MAINKIIKSDGTVIFDATSITITPEYLVSGKTTINNAGNKISGNFEQPDWSSVFDNQMLNYLSEVPVIPSYGLIGFFANSESKLTLSITNCVEVNNFGLAYNSGIYRLILPNCERLKTGALYGCSNIRTLSLGHCSVIEQSALYDVVHNWLNVLDLGDSDLLTIQSGAFSTYSNNTTWLGQINFNGKELIVSTYLPAPGSTSVLFSAPNLQKITGNLFYSIGSRVSAYCPNLEYLDDTFSKTPYVTVTPGKLKSVGNQAFYSINSSNFNLIFNSPLSQCTDIGTEVFNSTITDFPDNFINLDKIVCLGNINNSYLKKDEFSALTLSMCEKLYQSTFYSNMNLRSINIPNCTDIGSGAFWKCSNLSSISLTDKPIYFGSSAFRSCPSLSIPVTALLNCSGIGQDTFESVANENELYEALTSNGILSLPNCEIINVINVLWHPFSNSLYSLSHASISKIYLPKLKSVGGYCFSRFDDLTELYLDTCSSISRHAFQDSRKLSFIYIPRCEKIDYDAFGYRDYSISTEFHVGTFIDTVCQLYSSDSVKIGNADSIYIPASLVSAYQNDPIWGKYSSRIFPEYSSWEN